MAYLHKHRCPEHKANGLAGHIESVSRTNLTGQRLARFIVVEHRNTMFGKKEPTLHIELETQRDHRPHGKAHVLIKFET